MSQRSVMEELRAMLERHEAEVASCTPNQATQPTQAETIEEEIDLDEAIRKAGESWTCEDPDAHYASLLEAYRECKNE